jgi:hypothetical protein
MSAETDPGMDAYELALLAAQLLRRRNTESDAVDAAWALVEAAKDKLEGVRLRAQLESPEAQAAWDKQEAQRLDSLRIPYKEAVKLITSQTRLDYAKKRFKEFLTDKAKVREQTSEGIEARAGAMLIRYRDNGFTGTEAKRLKEEFEQWGGKGKQGRVRKSVTDGRLRENRQKKLQAKGKAEMAKLAKPKVEWRTKHYQAAVLKGARGKKARVYRDSADQQRDTPRGQAFDANPELQAALKEPGRT